MPTIQVNFLCGFKRERLGRQKQRRTRSTTLPLWTTALQLTTNEQTFSDDVVRKRGGTPMDALHAVHQARDHETTTRRYINGETRRRGRKENHGRRQLLAKKRIIARSCKRGNRSSKRQHMRWPCAGPASAGPHATSQPASTPAMSTRQPASPPSLPESGVTWPKPGSAPEPDRHRARASRCLRQWSGWGDQPKCTISKRLACANVRINLTQTNGLVN